MTESQLKVPDPDVLAKLRRRLISVGFTAEGVASALGSRAAAALARGETTPADAHLSHTSELAVLIRLWLLQQSVDLVAADRALGGLLEPLSDAGLVEVTGSSRPSWSDGQSAAALLVIRPYERGEGEAPAWLVSDRVAGIDGQLRPLDSKHVLGSGPAAATLGALLPAAETSSALYVRALDVGCGSGVQSIQLSALASDVVGIDISARALTCARISAALSELRWDLRHGDLFAPVAGESFDLVVANPPFVVSPAVDLAPSPHPAPPAASAPETPPRGVGHTYRDSGLDGDEISRRVLREGAAHLVGGGTLIALANWEHRLGQPWTERVTSWVSDLGCAAWVVQRDVQDPAQYVELWLRDSGLVAASDYRQRYADWLAWFDARGVEAVGFGWVALRKLDSLGGAPEGVWCEEWPHALELPLGSVVQQTLQALVRAGKQTDDQRLSQSYVCADSVLLEEHGEPGAEHPQRLVLRSHRGMLRAREVSTVLAGFVGACDGSLPAGLLCDALADVLDTDPSEVRREVSAALPGLVRELYLHYPA